MRMLQHARRHLRARSRICATSGHSAPEPSQRMRQNTLEPGAARAIFSTSASQSTAKEPHAKRIGARDVALLLDRIAEADAIGRRAGGERSARSRRRRPCRSRSRAREQREHFRRGIGLHGVEDARVRQRLGEAEIVLAHDVEVDARGKVRCRGRLRGAHARNSRIRSVIAASPTKGAGTSRAQETTSFGGADSLSSPARDGDATND